MGGQTYSFIYGYDLAGELKSETYPSGRVVNTTFDVATRPQTTTSQGASTAYVQQAGYWPHGAGYYWQYGNTVWPVEGYTAQLTPWYNQAALNDSGNSYLLSLGATWNNNNTVQQTSEGFGNAVAYNSLTFMYQNYTYDHLNRLQGVNDTNYLRGFNYDEFGNMSVSANGTVTLQSLTPYSGGGVNPYSAATNRLVSTMYGYDQRGDLTAAGAVAMTYDAEANLVHTSDTVNGQPVSISYVFDAEGQRVEKQTSGGATVVDVHDAFGKLAAEYNSVGVTPACTTCYLVYDGLGSVRLVTDQSGNVVARHDYLPFGEEVPNGVAGRSGNFGATANLTQGFTGQESDSGTVSLDYFNARHMSAVIGAFAQPDPMQAGADFLNPQSWNGYGYVLGNPLGLVDPSGMTQQNAGGVDWYNCYSAEYAYPCYGIPIGGWGGSGGGGGGAPSGGGGGGGSPSSGGGVTGSLPPGSFPGGENLGLPPGIQVPNPLSPQVLLGLWGWNCDNAICVPGFGSIFVDPTDYSYDVPSRDNVVSVYRRQVLTVFQNLLRDAFCPSSGPGPLFLKNLRNGIIRGAISGAIKGGSTGAVAGSPFEGVGAVPGAALGAATGATTSVITSTLRIKSCGVLKALGY